MFFSAEIHKGGESIGDKEIPKSLFGPTRDIDLTCEIKFQEGPNYKEIETQPNITGPL